MKKILSVAAIGLAAMLIAAPAQAASFTNGDFEATDGSQVGTANGINQSALGGGNWDVYTSMPGWSSTSTPGFEIQTTGTVPGVTAHSGNKYIELESHPNPSGTVNIRQVFDVATTGTYKLSFFYQPRTNDPGDNLINVIFGTTALAVSGPSGTFPFGTWTEVIVSTVLYAGVNSGLLEFFASATPPGLTLGGFIDSVNIIRTGDAPPVPLPAGLILLLSGLAGIGYLGRSRAKAA